MFQIIIVITTVILSVLVSWHESEMGIYEYEAVASKVAR
jgi:hypothetical protein